MICCEILMTSALCHALPCFLCWILNENYLPLDINGSRKVHRIHSAHFSLFRLLQQWSFFSTTSTLLLFIVSKSFFPFYSYEFVVCSSSILCCAVISQWNSIVYVVSLCRASYVLWILIKFLFFNTIQDISQYFLQKQSYWYF